MTTPPVRRSGDELVAAARDLVPVLRERAEEADSQRRVHDETFAAIRDASLLHVLKPARYGGFEMGLVEYTRIGAELARGCASASWVYSLLAEHCWFISTFPEQAQNDVWGEDGYAVSAASLAADPARSQVERVGGGYRLSGRFPFASGSDHAQWLILGAVAETAVGRAPVAHLYVVPKP
jgi:3-hydroxy-9,10-secoandrosta-1,3,5(10)-triene-9,17-dione monooxygenase